MNELIQKITKADDFYGMVGDNAAVLQNDVNVSKTIPNESVDLIVTSPPYNLDMPYNTYEDMNEYQEYLIWTRRWLLACWFMLKDDGRICINIPMDTNIGGYNPAGADLIHIAKAIGYEYRSTVIWNKQNIHKRTAWGSWMSASAPFVIAPVELIILLCKNQWKKKNKGESDITRDEFMLYTNGLWEFPGAPAKKIGHPAPFPVELPMRCIKLFSYVGDIVLDPFLGSGTTLIATRQSGRVGIGMDMDADYCSMALERIRDETS